jgi:hypothetical protein
MTGSIFQRERPVDVADFRMVVQVWLGIIWTVRISSRLSPPSQRLVHKGSDLVRTLSTKR